MIREKTAKGYKFVAQNWRERIVYELFITYMAEGEPLPKFFLPVRKRPMYNSYECWIVPLAPIVLVGYLLHGAFASIWRDLVQLVSILENYNKRG